MFKNKISLFFTIISLQITSSLAFGQCAISTAAGNCNTGSVLNSGNTTVNSAYRFNGNATLNSINVTNNGVLTVCSGTLTINSGNMNNGGIIIVHENATLNFNYSPNFNNTFLIVNYGVINVNGNVTFQNGASSIHNHVTGVFNVAAGFQTTLNDNSFIINHNQMNLGDLRIQGNNRTAICMINGAVIDTRDLTNLLPNSVTTNGPSCFSVSRDLVLNQAFSTSADTKICYRQSTVSPLTQSNLGAAELFFNCDNCGVALPIELISFEAKLNTNNQVDIFWATASEQNNDFFTIERSTDGLNWEIVTTVAGAGNSINRIDYHAYDARPVSGISYYRLKQTDFDGAFEYSYIVSVFNGNEEIQLIKVVNIMGQTVEQNAKGLVILVFSNGQTLKIINE